ncbi:MAG: AAA family ATPase, partial [Paracoccaceae bacterium]
MQFTRMRLQGFKSFVDPTEVPIAPGLTGVVGPNGCGKSNLLEALRWVMGETSAKSMRGDGMEDVIFAGSSSRPARPWAEVSLHVDNADRTAPAEFNHADGLEIARRITRDLGSAYKLNGKDVRARDVRMLFADASTGAHSPALVRQGRIAELIDAKPKARRAILEEAAGIGGLYQRRHEAELKLRSAEANLSRVSDVLESLDQQLSGLARQAKQAANYRRIAAELKRAEALLLWLRWREAETARADAEAASRAALGEAARTEAAAQAAARAEEAAGAAVPPLREEDAVAAAVLQRALVERERIDERLRAAEAEAARLAGRAAQLERDLERERALGRDAGDSEAALDAEERELREAEAGQPERLAEAEEAARAAAATVEAEEATLDRLTGDAARLAARVQAAERRAAETAKAAAEAASARDKAEAEAARLAEGMPAAEATKDEGEAEVAAARAEAEGAEAALGEAETARGAAQEAEASARAASAGAEGEASALRAEARALEGMLAKEGGDGARMLDRVEVEAGWEKALGAALGDDLLAGEAGPGAAGWEALEGDAEGGALPAGVEPLADRVTAPPALARRLKRIGVVAPEAGERLRGTLAAGVRLVSREGDLWRWDGWRAAAGEAPTAAARRLEQRNRLAALKASLQAAEAAAAEARETAAAAKAALSAASSRETEAREARR